MWKYNNYDTTVVLILHYLAGTCGRISWIVCKNKNFLFYCSCKMGCWFLCQGWWWCSRQFRYALLYVINILIFMEFFSIPLLKLSLLLVLPFRYAGYYSCPTPVKAQSLHWLYEVWTCSISKVILLELWYDFSLSHIMPSLVLKCLISCFSRNVKYHEPEYWKFGEEGNKYFRHATGQIYALSKDLATYISINQ